MSELSQSERTFFINTPARFTDTTTPIPARNLAVIALPPDAGGPSFHGGENQAGEWSGWFPSCKPGLETPWDGVMWGRPPAVYPRDKDGNINFYPYAPVLFGEAFPLGYNELYPIIKKVRKLLGRDFYCFRILFDADQATGEYSGLETYVLTGEFPGFDFSKTADW